ncbi:hypothetical protein PPL_09265 [Heterostelium album PN500]|uniref:Uncharacterized protein n=1 Tax=Heterostelium pallidum (strain ATCC 26659 / Pp 5 / PN500) TaxID=670386 RepID=D3BL33_HETP5|nr:hypothetical protein PPL_09265 [Heterostelium album PN500]EFA77767.1 hypothetical protein PPL_09265 [Heterostelium album PN500]|eukprot:XP_020429895.1 hypothetical protein PPL_09265 [Heterostelium album PN500]
MSRSFYLTFALVASLMIVSVQCDQEFLFEPTTSGSSSSTSQQSPAFVNETVAPKINATVTPAPTNASVTSGSSNPAPVSTTGSAPVSTPAATTPAPLIPSDEPKVSTNTETPKPTVTVVPVPNNATSGSQNPAPIKETIKESTKESAKKPVETTTK